MQFLRALMLAAVSAAALTAVPRAADAAPARSKARLEYSWGVDGSVVGTGVAALLIAAQLNTDTRAVPPGGFNRDDVHWGVDRRVVHEVDSVADRHSNTTRDFALALPLVLGAFTAAPGNRLRASVDRIALHVEAAAISQGVVDILKKSVSRPRPYTYLAAADRPAASIFDVTKDRAFQSMPSGHASTAWCAVGVTLADPWLDAPDATWKRRAAVAFIGSTIATATGVLRTEGGQHFPTDVTAGSAIGLASGIAVPLLHRFTVDGAPIAARSRRGWFEKTAGLVAGIGAGVLLGEKL